MAVPLIVFGSDASDTSKDNTHRLRLLSNQYSAVLCTRVPLCALPGINIQLPTVGMGWLRALRRQIGKRGVEVVVCSVEYLFVCIVAVNILSVWSVSVAAKWQSIWLQFSVLKKTK